MCVLLRSTVVEQTLLLVGQDRESPRFATPSVPGAVEIELELDPRSLSPELAEHPHTGNAGVVSVIQTNPSRETVQALLAKLVPCSLNKLEERDTLAVGLAGPASCVHRSQQSLYLVMNALGPAACHHSEVLAKFLILVPQLVSADGQDVLRTRDPPFLQVAFGKRTGFVNPCRRLALVSNLEAQIAKGLTSVGKAEVCEADPLHFGV
mmetsp:Transcript_24963/g.47303  ORF Transcript_24963/g.47303 Transcript_24963/m.47303 type:complete len:208 (-) Transcript_24963:264-887(-)